MPSSFFKKIRSFFELLLSILGYVPKHATVLRTIVMSAALAFSVYLALYQAHNSKLALVYFVIAEVFYIGFIYAVLSKNGYRHRFIKKWGDENKGFLAFEATLGLLFFNNGVGIGYVASATSGNLFGFISKEPLFAIAAVMFAVGFTIKILAAKAASIDIYYWKDMFLGRKIGEFVVTGPYKYFHNPMYGIGQLQAYAVAIWYGSAYGLLAALLNQCLVFSFFYLVEKKFINRIYQVGNLPKEKNTDKIVAQ
ncbi:MAG: methyltransferase [bacterium]|nr:methyltransferase [bacterium]